MPYNDVYFCPVCKRAEWATKPGVENHIWHTHEQSKCCLKHKSKATSATVPQCNWGGMIAMATCAARGVYAAAGLPWPPEPVGTGEKAKAAAA